MCLVRAVKVVIQNTRTLQFLKADCSWGQSVPVALSFVTSMEALDFCIQHKLKEVQTLLRFDDGTPDVTLTVEDYWSRLRRDTDG